jgi:c-di-GMP-binding flagellar brake protein YcgR
MGELMEQRSVAAMPLDVEQRVWINFPDGQVSTIVRGWRPSEVILVDVPDKDYARQHLQNGARCRIRYLREGVFYRFETQVLEIMGSSNTTQFLGLDFPRQIQSQNLRSFPRVKLQVPGRLVDEDGRPWTAEVQDLSLGGCRVEVTGRRFTMGERLTLSCEVSNQSLIDVSCVVKRNAGNSTYGLAFLELNNANQDALERLLNLLTAIQAVGSDKELKQGMVGNLDAISLPDLLHILVYSRKSYQVDLVQGTDHGRFCVADGEVIYAQSPHYQGPDAVFELFSWANGRYRVQQATLLPRRNVHIQLEHILLEFAFRQDAANESAQY